MFAEINRNYKYCLKDDTDSNVFFKGIYGIHQYDIAKRDCTKQCFGYNKIYIESSKLCVDDCKTLGLFEYNHECINKCPKRTKPSINNICENLDCEHYYNFEQTECIDKIPDGFYLNDTLLKTINSCPIECKTCNTESIQNNLCISCNDNYHPKINDSLNVFQYIKCYRSLDGYYLDSNDSYFKLCYDSCKSCDRKENEEFHYCLECKDGYDNNFSYQNRKYFNCYKEITYYYFDRNINKFYFFTYSQCPSNYSKAIINKRQCIEECYLDDQYYYEFKKKCYNYCPDNTKISEDKTYYCDPICPSDLPFEILDTQECVENCDISMIYNNSCRLNYDKTNINIFLNNIHNNLISINFNFSKINNNEDIIFRFLNSTIIITTDNKNLQELVECEFMLKNNYNISNEE